MNYGPQAAELAQAKAEHAWLKEVPGHCLQQALMDLDKACRRHGTFGVHWRSARRWVASFRFLEGSKMKVERLNRGKSQVQLPKLGWVKYRASRSLDGETIRSATLTKEGPALVCVAAGQRRRCGAGSPRCTRHCGGGGSGRGGGGGHQWW